MSALARISPAARPPRFPPSRGSLAAAAVAASRCPEPPPGALRLFDTVPPGHLVHHAEDDTAAPLIRAGEIAIIAPGRDNFVTYPGLFLMLYGRRARPTHGPARLSFALRDIHPAEAPGDDLWWASPYCRRRSGGAAERQVISMSDGPLTLDQMLDQVVGRVVGIYAPSHRGDLA